MICDIHYHFGKSYARKGTSFFKKEMGIKDTLSYIEENKLTHLVCLYVEECREDLKKLIELTPCKIYPFIWLKTPSIEEIDFSFDVGVKLHGIRTPYEINSHQVYKVLKKLPDNFLVLSHTQGSISPKNINTPIAITSLALKFPNLKFIIGHAGDFGFLSWEGNSNEEDKKKRDSVMFRVQTSKQSISSACLFAREFDNLFVDGSSLWNQVPWKSKFMMGLCPDKWGFGSDYPFNNAAFAKNNIKNQIKALKKHVPTLSDQDIEKIFKNTVDFLEKKI